MNYIKLLNTLGKLIKEGQIKSIDEALQMVQQTGAKVDGLLRQGVENLFKTTKARNPEAFKGWTPEVIEGGKSPKKWTDKSGQQWIQDGDGPPIQITEGIGIFDTPYKRMKFDADIKRKIEGGKGKEGVENLFKETKKVDLPEGVNWKDTPLPVNPKVESFYDELVENAYKESKKTGRDVKTIIEETIGYKFTGDETGKEILDIVEEKFFKADGGRVGFQVGGLSEQAQGIYDSWISAGHSSQDALDYLSSRGMYDAGGGGGGVESIINTQQSIVPGGNQSNTTPIGTQIANFNQARADRQTRLENPNTIQGLINNYTGGGQRTVNKMLQSGNIGDFRKTQGLPFGIGQGIARMLPDKYYDLPVQDQAFIQSMMGFEDEGGMSNKDPFGINVRSMFGNYANYVRNINQKLAGREFKPGSWQDQRQKFYAEIEKDRVRQEETAKAAAARDIALYAEAQRTGDADAASGAGGNVDPGGPASRMGWSDLTDDEGDKYATGGLATMFTRRR